jgi:pimeloyl-ACP methyl ester carboxylesterase
MLEQGLRVPVQVLSGTRSWQAARQLAEGVAERVAGARLLKLVGLRHMAPLTHPHLVNAVILDYILPLDMPGQAVAA